MARRRSVDQQQDNVGAIEQDDAGGMAAAEQTARGPRRKPEVAMGRITLSLTQDTIRKLRFAAIDRGVQPCRLVEDLLRPVVAPYVLSIRGRRAESEAGEAA